MEGRAEAGLEEEVEHLRALGLGVINEQPGRRAGAARPDALEHPACGGGINDNVIRGARNGRQNQPGGSAGSGQSRVAQKFSAGFLFHHDPLRVS